MHLLIGSLLGAAIYHLYHEHRKRGIDQCTTCQQFEQIGKGIKYIPVSRAGVEVQLPYCKSCKPEIFT
jgi:hypothetical protein